MGTRVETFQAGSAECKPNRQPKHLFARPDLAGGSGRQGVQRILLAVTELNCSVWVSARCWIPDGGTALQFRLLCLPQQVFDALAVFLGVVEDEVDLGRAAQLDSFRQLVPDVA